LYLYRDCIPLIYQNEMIKQMTIEKEKNTVGIFGLVIKGFDDFQNINVLIEKGESIRITGIRKAPKWTTELKKWDDDAVHAFDLTFAVGQKAVYDSYNFDYLNPILSVGEKTVAFEGRRLTLAEFIRHNYDFDMKKINDRRASWSD
jgi:hypothetical protein